MNRKKLTSQARQIYKNTLYRLMNETSLHKTNPIGKHIFTSQGFPLFALLVSLGLLCGAWFFQYVLGYLPCQMCYWQRHGHKVVIGLALSALILKRVGFDHPRAFTALITLALFSSAALGLWHMGVEFKWWDGPKTCGGGGTPDLGSLRGADLLGSLDEKIKPPACSTIVWSLLGLSMAGWNMVISACGGLIGLLALRSKHV